MRDGAESILAAARAGDRQALAQLIDAHTPGVFRLARYLLGSAAEAEDAAAEVMARVCAAPRSLPPQGLRPWLMRVTYNHCCDLLRRRGTLARLLPRLYARSAAAPAPGPEQATLERHEQERVRRAVAGLPVQERAAVVLRYYQEMSYAEIAAALGIPAATVGTRLHRARERLRQALGSDPGGEQA